MPLKTVMIVAAVMLFMLKTVVRYIRRLDKVPMVPSFSKVSFPEIIIIIIIIRNNISSVAWNWSRRKRGKEA